MYACRKMIGVGAMKRFVSADPLKVQRAGNTRRDARCQARELITLSRFYRTGIIHILFLQE